MAERWSIAREAPKGTRCFGCNRIGRDVSLIADGWGPFPGFGWVCPECLPEFRRIVREAQREEQTS
jgi:hypothetical protein